MHPHPMTKMFFNSSPQHRPNNMITPLLSLNKCAMAATYALALQCTDLVFNCVLMNQIRHKIYPSFGSVKSVNYSWEDLGVHRDEFARQSFALHSIQITWYCVGLTTTMCLVWAMFWNRDILCLPWLSWSSIEFILKAYNLIIDTLKMLYFGNYEDWNYFISVNYILLPVNIMMIVLVSKFYCNVTQSDHYHLARVAGFYVEEVNHHCESHDVSPAQEIANYISLSPAQQASKTIATTCL